MDDMNPIKLLVTPFTVLSTHNVELAAKLWRPESSADVPYVLFVHQYAKMGGCGQLLEGMAQCVARQGYPSVTFDLRGAGKSSGLSTFTNYAEVDDVKAMINYIEKEFNRDIVIVGSSGGASLAGAVLDYSSRVRGGLFIGYTWGWWASFLFGWAFSSIESSTKPKLFVVGDRDQFTSMSQYEEKIRNLEGKINEIKLISGKDHFEIEGPVYDETISTWLVELILKITSPDIMEGEKCPEQKVS